MHSIALALTVLPLLLAGYAYLLYPVLVKVLALLGNYRVPTEHPEEWPPVSITVPVHNEEATIAATLDAMLALDYPEAKRQIVVVSDASTDATERIVEAYADRGVELLRLAARRGKTAAENFALPHLKGDIVINTDASVRLHPAALKPLIAAFADESVGVASGRDISVDLSESSANWGESGYVGYEMWIRSLETRAGGIVGASGCFYATRRHLHMELVPEALSRDFAAPLIAREHGYRSVSVDEAISFVPRTSSLGREYRRKVRTMTRGLDTLFYKRELLNPIRYGTFAWMLFSHKLARWLVPWAFVVGIAALSVLAFETVWARALLALGAGLTLAVALWWLCRRGEALGKLFAIPVYLLAGLTAGLHAWINALARERNPIWDPTRREAGSG